MSPLSSNERPRVDALDIEITLTVAEYYEADGRPTAAAAIRACVEAARANSGSHETPAVDPNSKEAISLDLEKIQTELDDMTREHERYKRCLYRANGRLIQMGQEPEKLDYPEQRGAGEPETAETADIPAIQESGLLATRSRRQIDGAALMNTPKAAVCTCQGTAHESASSSGYTPNPTCPVHAANGDV